MRGRAVLSVGSGLGFLELFFASHGASMTCVDIVASNLEVIRRKATLSRVSNVETRLVQDPECPEYGPADSCDVALFYGSLMTMPLALQQACIQQVKSVLRPGGTMILMLYTWEFARETCGWSDPSQFDPAEFARASDPSVGEEHCPWSDWHDDAKVLALAGPGMVITRRQIWNQGRYVWYELGHSSEDRVPGTFFTEATLLEGQVLFDLPLEEFTAADATVVVTDDTVDVATTENQFHYALVSPSIEIDAGRAENLNLLVVELFLMNGGLSVGLLDEVENRFIATALATTSGKHRLVLRFPGSLSSLRVVFSNHRQLAGASTFHVHRVAFMYRPLLSLELDSG